MQHKFQVLKDATARLGSAETPEFSQPTRRLVRSWLVARRKLEEPIGKKASDCSSSAGEPNLDRIGLLQKHCRASCRRLTRGFWQSARPIGFRRCWTRIARVIVDSTRINARYFVLKGKKRRTDGPIRWQRHSRGMVRSDFRLSLCYTFLSVNSHKNWRQFDGVEPHIRFLGEEFQEPGSSRR